MSKLLHKWNYVVPRIRSDFEQAGLSDRLDRSDINVLEYGSGIGDTALRFALDHPGARVVGADIRDADPALFEKLSPQVGVDRRPRNLSYVNMAKPLPQAGNLIARPSEINIGLIPDHAYDICYSWCVFEHVDTQILASTLKHLYGLLRPGGLFYVMINPLYFSEFGSHLNGILQKPWIHLELDIASLRESFFAGEGQAEGRQFMWEQFETLNRLTAGHLRMLVGDAGFEVVWEDRKLSGKPSPGLRASYDETVLRTKEITLISRKPSAP